MALPTWRILAGDALEQLTSLPDESVDCIVTSPPYWGLRDYGVSGQLGLEPTIQEHITVLTTVFREARRVLSRRGTLWLNYGDTYAGPNRGGQGKATGIASSRSHDASRDAQKQHPDRVEPLRGKSKVGMPWRIALALIDDGWMLRQEIIWHKPNPMPESCKDRPTTSHEPVFLFARSRRYFYDTDAAREPVTGTSNARSRGDNPKARRKPSGWDDGAGDHQGKKGRYPKSKQNASFSAAVRGLVDDRNWRSVWTIQPEAFKGAHFATMPRELAARCIIAGCPAGGTVLDPFAGAGTTLLVALDHQRNALGIELSPEYLSLAQARIRGHVGLLATELPT